MPHQVFICHASKDKQVAGAACAALEAQRISCWIAPRDILAGEEYGESIVDAVSDCQIVLLIFSLDANNSPQVRREIERAVSKGKIIVPFRIEEVMPSRAMEFALSNTHWLDALTPPMERHLVQLCDTISRLIQKHKEREPPLSKPQGPLAEDAKGVRGPILAPVQEETKLLPPVAQPGSRRTPQWWLRPRVLLSLGVALILLAVAVFAILRFYPRVQPFNSILIEQITEEGDITNIAMSPDGNTLAEVKSVGGQHSIWVRNISTGRDIQILPPVSLDYGSLVFSRDGNELYFVRDGEDNSKSFSLYSLSVFGGEPRLIIRNVSRAISLSPDQKHLAYEKNTEGASEVHIDGLEGDDKIVANAAGDLLSSPVWSPNGRSLAWVIHKDDPEHPAGIGRPVITILEINSKKQREMSLPSDISGVTDLDWLPSGKQLLLLFSRFYSGFAAGDQIGLMSIDSGDFRHLTTDMVNHFGLTLSANGTTIATLVQQGSSEIGFYDSAGAKLISTTRLPGGADSLVWLDDDTLLTLNPWLTTLRRDNAEIKDIELVFPPGNLGYGFSGSNSSNTSPAVCPDGDIVLTGSVDGTDQIYLVDSHGHFVRTLVKVQGSGVFCSQENKLAYYSAADPKDPSIWSVSLAGGAPRKVMSIPHAAAIVYSVNGKIAAYVLDNGAGSTATIMNLDQRKVVREFPIANHAHETLPHFTPDGSALAFVEQQTQGFALASQPMSGSEPRILTTWLKDPIKDFGWSPSGKTLAIMWDRSTSDVALITDKSAKPRD